jgi:hypothetical protein
MNYVSTFKIGDRVTIDGDQSIRATICAVTFYSDCYEQYKVCWINNGAHQEIWMESGRLRAVE